MTKTYGPDVVPDPEELVPWMEATAAEHQRRRFEEEPDGATPRHNRGAPGARRRRLLRSTGPRSPELLAFVDRLRAEDQVPSAKIFDRWLGCAS
jgi:hypothetical protein